MDKPKKLSKYELMKMQVDPVWAEYLVICPDEQAALKHIEDRRAKANLFTCRKCNSSDLIQNSSDIRSFRCKQCKTDSWLTSTTFFKDLNLPHSWCGAIYLKGRGLKMSVNYLSKLCKMSYSAADYMSKCIDFVMDQELAEPENQVGSAHFLDNFLRRSKATPFFAHPSAEEEMISKLPGANLDSNAAEPVHNNIGNTAGNTDVALTPASGTLPQEILDTLEKEDLIIVEMLQPGAKSIEEILDGFNKLNSLSKIKGLDEVSISAQALLTRLSLLEIQGIVAIQPGNLYKLQVEMFARKIRTMNACGNAACDACLSRPKSSRFLKAFRKLVEDVYYGISRKNLQLFVSSYKFGLEAKKNKDPDRVDLMELCLRSDRATRKQIMDYVTAPLVVF